MRFRHRHGDERLPNPHSRAAVPIASVMAW
jgi:hypothetical protein